MKRTFSYVFRVYRVVEGEMFDKFEIEVDFRKIKEQNTFEHSSNRNYLFECAKVSKHSIKSWIANIENYAREVR